MKYEFIEAQRHEHSVQILCEGLDVAPSGYYAWRQEPRSKQEKKDAVLAPEIKRIFDESGQTYGYIRIWQECRAQGIACGKHRIARIMRENGWYARIKKQRRQTTNSNPAHPKAPNLLQQAFEATDMNQKWTTDITYIQTGEGWLYLAVVLDLFSRRVVGWAIDGHMEKTLVLAAFKMAVEQRTPSAELLHHSDQGSQYTSQAYRDALAEQQMIVSMSRRGNCYDNAVTESFFATLKTERVYRRVYATKAQAKQDIFTYIEGFYNTRRRHSTLGYVSPVAFEKQHLQRANNLSSVCLH